MISHPDFELSPWAIRETALDLDVLAQSESVFALSNGHIGLRGNLDEGDPHGLPGTYLNGFYELRPLPYPEGGYGNPEASQTLVNVTNGKIMRLLVDDEPLDVRYGQLNSHERELDLRAGVLHRKADWTSPAGGRVRVSSTRLVSFAQRAVAAIRYTVEPVDQALRVVVQSELVANEVLPGSDGDPRSSAVTAPLDIVPGPRSPQDAWQTTRARTIGLLTHSTHASKLLMAAGMDHVVDGPASTESNAESFGDEARVTIASDLQLGERLQVVKFVTYGWSSARSLPAIRDQTRAALVEAIHTGWEGLLAEQRSYLDDFWARADVQIDGDPELQLAVRFGLFHCLQASARAERRAIPAKGLTGPGYDGHTFWDVETFVLPVLSYTAPTAARDALAWRHATLDLARERAGVLGLKGAAFPWRTIRGQECSGYWPAGTAAFHINADIADAVVRYRDATGDLEFEHDMAVELLVETARLWRALGHHDGQGSYRIDGVTGPDEYSAVADNNVYTNLMARRNLTEAADACERHMDVAAALGVDREEAASWRDAAKAMMIPYDAELKVHQQAEAFTQHQTFDFADTGPERYPLLLHFPYFDLYRKQVVKQADLVLALHLCGDAFTDEEKARDFRYYEQLTVRDSSLSACTQAVIAAEVGHLELAYDYFSEAALMDLDDLEHNTRDGLHIASLAGAWLSAVAGFGGMRDHNGTLTFTPRLPREIVRLAFGLTVRGQVLRVSIEHDGATYTLDGGDPLTIGHHGQSLTVAAQEPVTRPIPPIDPGPRPRQPPGRAPAKRERARGTTGGPVAAAAQAAVAGSAGPGSAGPGSAGPASTGAEPTGPPSRGPASGQT